MNRHFGSFLVIILPVAKNVIGSVGNDSSPSQLFKSSELCMLREVIPKMVSISEFAPEGRMITCSDVEITKSNIHVPNTSIVFDVFYFRKQGEEIRI